MTDTPLIRAAKAIWERRGMDPDELCSDHGKMVPLWKTSLPLARAVLEAVREPSEGMKAAGRLAGQFDTLVLPCGGSEGASCDAVAEFDGAEAVWQAMIDAALSE